MDMTTATQDQTQSETTIGNTVAIKFASVGHKAIEGKVDTGATTSSIHATNISVDRNGGTVNFTCPALSNNTISMASAGTQEVSSADGGDQSRPMIKLDIEINGVSLRDVVFNLNDRSNMDSMVLIGQNILKAGHFLIDVNQDSAQDVRTESADVEFNRDIIDAVKVIIKHKLSFDDFLKLARTASVAAIEE